MKQNTNSFLNFFLKFSGEDFTIINRSRTHNAFVGIGVFVFIIFLLCFASSFSFLYNSFQGNIFLSAPIGILWGLLVATIYVFLIYTITPILLPTPKKRNHKIIGEVEPLKFDYNDSFFLRYLLIIFLAIIVAQPLNGLLLKKYSQRSLEKHKMEYKLDEVLRNDSVFVTKELDFKNNFAKRTFLLSPNDSINLSQTIKMIDNKVNEDSNSLNYGISLKKNLRKLKQIPFSKKNKEKFDTIFSEIENLLEKEKNSDADFLEKIENITISDNYLKPDFDRYKNSITAILREKADRLRKLETLIDKSNFYITNMSIILRENPVSWFITMFSVFIFSFPIYKKYRIGKKTDFFMAKQNIELKMVQENYEKHLEQYKNKLTKKLLGLNAELNANVNSELQKLKLYAPEKYEKLNGEIKEDVSELFRSKYQF